MGPHDLKDKLSLIKEEQRVFAGSQLLPISQLHSRGPLQQDLDKHRQDNLLTQITEVVPRPMLMSTKNKKKS